MRSLLIALVAAAWIATGAAGAYRYVHGYDVYRGFPAPHTPAGVASGRVVSERFFSRALGTSKQYLVYLPPHYAAQAAAGRRFGVLYLLHGWPGRPSVFLQAGAMGVAADVLLAHHRIPPLIMVMPEGKVSFLHGDTEWANAGAGRYEDYVLEVVRQVDAHFATVPRRGQRALAGLSEGGYAALNIALHHLNEFSIAESWSGYFRQERSGPFANASAAQLRANSPADEVPALAPEIRRLGLRTWLYQGRDDSHDPANIRDFAAQLAGAGATVHYGFFPGGHDWGLWRAQVPRMLTAAGRWFGERPGRALLARTGTARPRAVLARLRAERLRRCLTLKPGQRIGLTCRAYRRAKLGHP